jgi:hypothetical protein
MYDHIINHRPGFDSEEDERFRERFCKNFECSSGTTGAACEAQIAAACERFRQSWLGAFNKQAAPEINTQRLVILFVFVFLLN